MLFVGKRTHISPPTGWSSSISIDVAVVVVTCDQLHILSLCTYVGDGGVQAGWWGVHSSARAYDRDQRAAQSTYLTTGHEDTPTGRRHQG